MKKEGIRREVVKLMRFKGRKLKEVQLILRKKHEYSVSLKTLKRWIVKYRQGWNLKDKSRKPNKLPSGLPTETQKEVIKLRRLTAWSGANMKKVLERRGIFISKSSIERIIRKAKLSKGSKMQGIRLKYVRWQRQHPNSLWQIDGAILPSGNWLIAMVDDCTRYCIGLAIVENFTTEAVLTILEQAMLRHGKPREILTDNGTQFKDQFDQYLKDKDIKHIKTGIGKPTTTGKIERFIGTYKREIMYCYDDSEYFRYRYNVVRPHTSLNFQTPAEEYFNLAKLF